MKIFPVNQIAEIDKYTIDHEPILSINLMERASLALYKWLMNNCKMPEYEVMVGPGNNGGDALAVARMLLLAGHKVNVWMIAKESKLSSDNAINLSRVRAINENCIHFVEESEKLQVRNESSLIIDGLFGSGLNRPLEGLVREVVKKINDFPNKVVSIDVPSGLFGEDNSGNNADGIVKAWHTLTFQFPKLAFLFAENAEYVGNWEVLEIGLHSEKIDSSTTPYFFQDRQEVGALRKVRNKFSHKGHFGHALLLSGSYGKMGAAVLASRACLKGGAGLLTTHVPRLGYQIIQTAVPEAMASIDRSDILISEFPDLGVYSAVGIGPGIGTKPNTQTALKEILQALDGKPVVIDADAINILAECPECWSYLGKNCILTPHPGEFDRLAGASHNGYERLQKARELAKAKGVSIVLKGAYSAIISADGDCYFNASGNPGMATAGSGDVLTGLLLALLSQGYQPIVAARLGVFLHGLAGDMLLKEESVESIVAGDLIDKLGSAFKKI